LKRGKKNKDRAGGEARARKVKGSEVKGRDAVRKELPGEAGMVGKDG